jgi:hypothetical protein
MGLLSFFKSDTPAYTDKVWKESDFAIKGMMMDALQAITRNEMPVILTFFTDTHQQVIDFLTAKQVPNFVIDSSNVQDAILQNQVVFVMDANLLNSSAQVLPFLINQTKKQKLNFLFFGHYPIPSRENKICEKLMAVNGTVTFYSSLDDPAFKVFGGDQLKSTMENLGLADEEAIEHNMVTRAMKNAREKIEKSIKQEIICSTQLEWFQRNHKKE